MQMTNNVRNKSLVTLLTNGIIMALYLVLTILVAPVASGPVQFRISESLNHLVVFNRKLMWGVLGGVVAYNLFWGYGVIDALFGGAQTLISLGLTALLYNVVKSTKVRLALNTIFFTATMAIIAYMLTMSSNEGFWGVYFSLALSEFATMAVAAPLMYFLDKGIHFADRV